MKSMFLAQPSMKGIFNLADRAKLVLKSIFGYPSRLQAEQKIGKSPSTKNLSLIKMVEEVHSGTLFAYII